MGYLCVLSNSVVYRLQQKSELEGEKLGIDIAVFTGLEVHSTSQLLEDLKLNMWFS